jgi:hypothetical protein
MTSLDFQGLLNAVPVSVEDLHLAVHEVHKSCPRSAEVETRLVRLAGVFGGQREKGAAVEARLTAMANIVSTGALPAHVVSVVDGGAVDVGLPVWQAAATLPLIVVEEVGDVEFDAREFLDATVQFAGQAAIPPRLATASQEMRASA